MCDIFNTSTHRMYYLHSPSGRGSSPVTEPSAAPAAAVLAVQKSQPCSWTVPQQFFHLH